MSQKEKENLASAYALGATDPEQRESLERQTSEDENLRRSVSDFGDVASKLLFHAKPVTPRAKLKAEIMAQIKTELGQSETRTDAISPFFFLKSNEGVWDSVADGITAKTLFADTDRRLTTMLVRMGPDSIFPGHAHHGPEELYMLEGDCLCAGESLGPGDYHRADGTGDHGLTSTINGCLMLVFSPEIDVLEDHQTTIQSNGTNASENGKTSPFFFMKSAEGTWDAVAEGLSAKVLYADEKRNRTSMVLRMQAGSTFPGHAHHGPEEVYMLEGDCLCEGETLGSGDYHRVAGGGDHGVTSTVNGCLMFLSAPEIEVFE